MPSRFEISDELWAEVEPLIPARPRRRRYPGRKAIDDRLVLNGILHVLHTGITWKDLPRENGYGSAFPEFFAAVKPFFSDIEEMKHYELQAGSRT